MESLPSHTDPEKVNLAHWDELAPVHLKSYPLEPLRNGGVMLDSIQLREVGAVAGKTLLHLQCHIGSDTLSWVWLGATATGVDFSPASIDTAEQLRDELRLPCRFICCNVYDLPQRLDEQFDIVYASQGVLCWLRDIDEWGGLVARYLKPGGLFYIMDTHPLIQCFAPEPDAHLVQYTPYFNRQPTMYEAGGGDYSDGNYKSNNPACEWVWTLSDIVNSLIRAGLTIKALNEYDSLYYKAFPSMIPAEEPGWWRYPGINLPWTFTLSAIKTH